MTGRPHAKRLNAANVVDWVEPIPEAGCWIWLGSVNKFGHGTATGTLAHRAIYELLVGPVESGIDVMHLCHNRLCVNPTHLKPGTRKENVDMSVDAGRWNKPLRSKLRKEYMSKHSVNGVFPGKSGKLSAEKAVKIRARHERGKSFNDLAADYNVSSTAIRSICQRKVYAYV
jgi:hypothetical protein